MPFGGRASHKSDGKRDVDDVVGEDIDVSAKVALSIMQTCDQTVESIQRAVEDPKSERPKILLFERRDRCQQTNCERQHGNKNRRNAAHAYCQGFTDAVFETAEGGIKHDVYRRSGDFRLRFPLPREAIPGTPLPIQIGFGITDCVERAFDAQIEQGHIAEEMLSIFAIAHETIAFIEECEAEFIFRQMVL